MTTRFLIIAAVMVVFALACVLVPLLRSARREGHPRVPFVLALLLALTMPPVVLGGYLLVGTPQALATAPVADGHASLLDAAQQLQASLANKPNDAQGWALLAQAYSTLNQPQQALQALDHLLKLKPNDADALVAWVEAKAATSPKHLIDDAARAKLQHALQLDATHQRALWLLGISDFQRQQYADAARQWTILLPLLAPGSKVAATVQQELDEARARARAGGAATAGTVATDPAAPKAAPAAPSENAPALNVSVRLDPRLANQLKPGDALFVFARAVNGPPMPLAVARLHPSRLPVEVTLTDRMAMAPGMELSKFAKVQVLARISRNGNATAQPGDLESAPVEVATHSHAPIVVTIDKLD